MSCRNSFKFLDSCSQCRAGFDLAECGGTFAFIHIMSQRWPNIPAIMCMSQADRATPYHLMLCPSWGTSFICPMLGVYVPFPNVWHVFCMSQLIDCVVFSGDNLTMTMSQSRHFQHYRQWTIRSLPTLLESMAHIRDTCTIISLEAT